MAFVSFHFLMDIPPIASPGSIRGDSFILLFLLHPPPLLPLTTGSENPSCLSLSIITVPFFLNRGVSSTPPFPPVIMFASGLGCSGGFPSGFADSFLTFVYRFPAILSIAGCEQPPWPFPFSSISGNEPASLLTKTVAAGWGHFFFLSVLRWYLRPL